MSTEITFCQRCKVVLGPQDPKSHHKMIYLDGDGSPQLLLFSLCPSCRETLEEFMNQELEKQEAEREAAEAKRKEPSVH